MRPSRRHRVLVLLALACGCGRPAGEPPPPGRVLLATTTSTAHTGLLDVLLPEFERETGIPVHFVAVGTGAALKHGEHGDVDLVLVHAPEAETEFVRRGFGEARVPLMYNDFVLLGPPEDPAAAGKAETAAEALERIAEAGALFISRGDRSGTHLKELSLWEAAGRAPGGPWYLEAGQGMGASLVLADEKRAYVLCDRGTYLGRRLGLGLVVLFAGDSRLRNPYSLIAVPPSRRPGGQAAGARRLIAWLTSPAGRDRIASFQVGGDTLFYPLTGPSPP